MAVLEEVSERGLGLPLGVGLLVLALSAGPKLVKSGRPLIKRAIKGYLTLQEKSKEMFAETAERMQDIYAEAKHEYDQEAVMMKAESDMMPEPVMAEEARHAEGAKPSEGAKRTPRARKSTEEPSEE